MFNMVDELDLNESYAFDVKTQIDSETFAAKLILSPESIKITIHGEINEKRKPKLCWRKLDELICRNGNQAFILRNLRGLGGRESSLTTFPEFRGFFEISYEVGYVVFSPASILPKQIDAISIQSSMLQVWLGNTKKQEEIIEEYYNHTLFSGNSNHRELVVKLNQELILSIGYNIVAHHDSTNFSAGVNFTPVLTVNYFNSLHVETLLEHYLNLYSLLSFLYGNDFQTNKILLENDSNWARKRCSLYYPSQLSRPSDIGRRCFFPIGRSLRYETLGLPELPLDALSTYYQLPKIKSNLFSKYLKYKRLNNPEEQFLGFFRLLETLTFKKKTYFDEVALDQLIHRSKPYLIRYFGDAKSVKSFLGALPRFNQSKYNTSKCIKEFIFKLSPEIIDTWKFGEKDMDEICRLRNDITHANDFHINEYQLFEKIKFIEVLLVYALFELLKIEFSIVDKIIDRLNGYHLILQDRESPF